MAVKVHMRHAASGGALCGALRFDQLTADPDAVTCPLCDALLAGQEAAQLLVVGVQDAVTGKLAELQRDPGVRVLTKFARAVLLADRETRASKDGERR
jgi:hypothetical protein